MLAGIALLVTSCKAIADCSWLKDSYSTVTYNYSPPISLVGSSRLSYIIHQDYISGTSLAAMMGASKADDSIIQCTSGSDVVIFDNGDFPSGTLSGNSSFKFIRPNNDVHIGFNFRSSKPSDYWTYPNVTSGGQTIYTVDEIYALNGTSFAERNGLLSWSDIILRGGYNINIYAYKASEAVNSGMLPAGILGSIRAGSLTLIDIYFSGVDVTSASCEVGDYPAEVSLGTVHMQQLRNPGYVENETTFSISMACDDYNLIPAIAFEGPTDGTYNTVFRNTSGSGYAANVGVQLLRNGSIITPGIATAVSLGRVTATTMDFDFSARLFRLNGNVTAGLVEVPVTFTIVYE